LEKKKLKGTVFGVVFSVFLMSLLVSNITIGKGDYLTQPKVFRLLAIEEEYYYGDYMRSAQCLIEGLLQYPNWNNSTDKYVSYIHLVSMYNYSEVDDQVKPFWVGKIGSINLQNEIISFLGNASPGEIVILYYCGRSMLLSIPQPHIEFLGISPSDLRNWLNSTLSQAYLTLIFDTYMSGWWTDFSPESTVLAACERNETSYGWINQWLWFTYIGIVEGFSFAEDANSDGWISAAEVFAYAKPATEAYSESFGVVFHPTSYFGKIEGDIPLVQRDISKPFPLWDGAVTSISVGSLRVEPGTNLTINVTVENQGEKLADLDVSIYANSSFISTKRITLLPSQSANLSFIWFTEGYGVYVLNCTVSICPGEEDVSDNVYHERRIVTIALLADLNLDCYVDIKDVCIVILSFGETPNGPRWNPQADINGDNYIDIKDIALICMNFGKQA